MDTEEIAEEVAEKIEEIGRDPRLKSIVNSPKFVPVAIAVVAVIGGGAVGYFLGRRRSVTIVEAEDDAQLTLDFSVDEAIRDARPTTTVVEQTTTETSVVLTEEELRERDEVSEFLREQMLIDQAKRVSPQTPKAEPVTEVEIITQNVFAQTNDEWDYPTELGSRTATAPYVLHKDEFYADEKGYTQVTLTFYAGDQIMADEEDTPVYNYQQVVGELKFGHGSGDPRTFHVRNDKRRAEYEVLLHDGHFSHEVLGLEAEEETPRDLKHSNTPRFRMD